MSHALPPAPPSLAQPLRGNPGAWFGPDSYPPAALRRSAQGRTVARLSNDAEGRVTGCVVVTSSGDADLDRATCSVARAKGQYMPAHGADGRPIAATTTLPVRWMLPQDGPMASPAAPVDPPPPPRHRGWVERLLAAHHLWGAAAALIAFAASRMRRLLTGACDDDPSTWSDGGRVPVWHRRRGLSRLVGGRAAQVAMVVIPAVVLAALMAWLGW